MPKLAIQLRQSKQFLLLQLCLLLGSGAVILYLPLSIGMKLVLTMVALIYSLIIFYRQNMLRALYHDETGWSVQTGNAVFQAQLAGDSTVTRWVSVLRFAAPSKFRKRSYVVFKDAMRPDEYRRLIVKVKYH